MDDFVKRWTPEELTRLLRLQGNLSRGNIIAIEITKVFETPPSNLAKITVTYSPDVPVDSPKFILLKIPKAHKLLRGKREIDFYTKIAPLLTNIPLVPCVTTFYEQKTGISYLFLKDVSATHTTKERDKISLLQFQLILDALACLHAKLWDYPNLEDLVGESPQEYFKKEYINNENNYKALVEQLKEQIIIDERKIFEKFLTNASKLILKRVENGRNMTLCHPENHHENFLLPYQNNNGYAYIIDWHQYRYWWGAKDIVSLVNRCLVPEKMHLVPNLLQFYYRKLVEYGVKNYSWDDCQNDYRLGIIDYLTIILQLQEAYNKYPVRFMEIYQGIIQEFNKWECASILF